MGGNKHAAEERRQHVEQLMGVMASPNEVQRRVADKFAVTQRTVRDDIMQIRRRWAEEADEVDREEVRYELILAAKNIYMAAMTRRSVAGMVDGNPVTYPDPHLIPACRAVELLRDLHGLNVLHLKHKIEEGPKLDDLPANVLEAIDNVIDVLPEPAPNLEALTDGQPRKAG